MNIALRKIAMLEKEFQRQEEIAKIEGTSSVPIDSGLRANIAVLMEKIRDIR